MEYGRRLLAIDIRPLDGIIWSHARILRGIHHSRHLAVPIRLCPELRDPRRDPILRRRRFVRSDQHRRRQHQRRLVRRQSPKPTYVPVRTDKRHWYRTGTIRGVRDPSDP